MLNNIAYIVLHIAYTFCAEKVTIILTWYNN